MSTLAEKRRPDGAASYYHVIESLTVPARKSTSLSNLFSQAAVSSINALSEAAETWQWHSPRKTTDYSAHYARTLKDWWQRIDQGRHRPGNMRNRFGGCGVYPVGREGGFAERSIGLHEHGLRPRLLVVTIHLMLSCGP